MCKNNGVLFENQLLQIGIKSEYRQNLGKLSECSVRASSKINISGLSTLYTVNIIAHIKRQASVFFRENVLILWEQDVCAVCQFLHHSELSRRAAVSYPFTQNQVNSTQAVSSLMLSSLISLKPSFYLSSAVASFSVLLTWGHHLGLLPVIHMNV